MRDRAAVGVLGVLCLALGCGGDNGGAATDATGTSGASGSTADGATSSTSGSSGADTTAASTTSADTTSADATHTTAGSDDGTDTSDPPGVDGDPCVPLMLAFDDADCADPSACAPIDCGCGASFGACADGRCVTGLDCEVLCALTPVQIQNCVERVYAPATSCVDDAGCEVGACVEYFDQPMCRDELPCIVDAQCTHHCADGSCAVADLPACTDPAQCDWACIDGVCTHGFAGSPCTESPQCEANFCVAETCSTGAPGEGCFADSNCRTDRCEMGVCIGLDLGAECSYEEQCTIEFCVGNTCTNGHRGAPCDDDFVCVGGSCDEASATCL
jgi:hypothetical protein